MGRTFVWDTETQNLLNAASVDYTASPYKLFADDFIHCAGFVDVSTGEEIVFRQREVYTHLKQFIMDTPIDEMIGHNTVNFDHLVLKMALGIDYKIGVEGTAQEYDTVGGKRIKITDTLVMSKTLNPDRHLHSIDYFGGILGLEKINWRAKAIELGLIEATDPKGAEFRKFHEEMVPYMMRDCHVNVKVWQWLRKEWGDWAWDGPFETEKAVAEIVTRQEHRGFKFDEVTAVAHVRTLDAHMERLSSIVEPLIPPKPLTQGALDDITPCVKQFKKDGTPVAHILNFAKKHGGEFLQGEDGVWRAELYGRTYELPMPSAPMWLEAPAKITDTLHIKEWLVGMGWEPTQYKERDLTVDSKKKKVTKEKFHAAVDKWLEQTYNSAFMADRLEMLEYSPRVRQDVLAAKLKSHDHMKRPLMVYTNPTLTVGMDKEIDPKLLDMQDKFAYAKEISQYLTYRHRRNSILGGGIDPDDPEDMQKGWLSVDRIRIDGRIQTPADTCGAATSRFKHRLVANIPRVTSMFGKEMRELFGVDSAKYYQMGYDFDSLEAKIEAHYVFRYPGGIEYGNSLTAMKPNDCHCFDDKTTILTPQGWKGFGELTLSDRVAQWADGEITFVAPSEIIWQHYEGKMIATQHSGVSQVVTPNHRVPYSIYKNEELKVGLAKDVAKLSGARLPPMGVLREGASMDLNYLNVLLAVQADGHFTSDCSAISLSFTKQRKIVALKTALDACNIKYSVGEYSRKGRIESTIRISSGKEAVEIRKILTPEKKLPWNFLELDYGCRVFITENVGLWDGTINSKGSIIHDSRCKQTTDVIQAIASSVGRAARVTSFYRKTNFGEGVIHRCYLGKNAKRDVITKYNTSEIDYNGNIGCVTVPSGFIVVRRDNKVSISGNSKLAGEISNLLGIKFPRSIAKNVKYGCSYNAQPPRVAKTVGCSLEDAKIIFDAFWEQAASLKALKEAMQHYWETKGGKKFLLGIDGRKLPIRSKGNVINTAFQSAGVICAKRAMIMHDRYLAEEGLLVDFFMEDWRNREHSSQQMIAYHDEAQSEVTKSSVEFKVFKFEGPRTFINEEDKEEQTEAANAAEAACVAFKAAQEKVWSDIGHTDTMYYVAYCRSGELAAKAVKEAGQHYKLNVELTAGYVMGKNWATCH